MNSEIPFDVPAPGGSHLTRLPYTPSFVDHSFSLGTVISVYLTQLVSCTISHQIIKVTYFSLNNSYVKFRV